MAVRHKSNMLLRLNPNNVSIFDKAVWSRQRVLKEPLYRGVDPNVHDGRFMGLDNPWDIACSPAAQAWSGIIPQNNLRSCFPVATPRSLGARNPQGECHASGTVGPKDEVKTLIGRPSRGQNEVCSKKRRASEPRSNTGVLREGHLWNLTRPKNSLV